MTVTLKSLRVIVTILKIYSKTQVTIHMKGLKQIVMALLSMKNFVTSIMALT